MQVTIPDTIKSDPVLVAVVNRATNMLEEEVGPSSLIATASWNVIRDDRNRPVLGLKIADSEGDLQGWFTLDELTHRHRFRNRIIRLWGDLLEAHSQKQMARVKETV